jgi:Fe-S-cluster-containing dehydrogenase component
MISRKTFLRLTGASVLVAATKRLVTAISDSAQAASTAPPLATRWGMAIDVGKCARLDGCQKCIQACNSLHNVPAIPDRNHEIRWIWKEPFEDAFRAQTDPYMKTVAAPVMVLCNHCDNPPCVRVCPTQATWKRPDGIVAMDWHRCIGCRYCVAACPYGSRSFNWVDPRPYIHGQNPDFPTRTKGVVEKCTLCSERLAVGRLPACVESCPEKAIVFGNLADPRSDIRELLRSRYHTRRKPELGTAPNVFYIV